MAHYRLKSSGNQNKVGDIPSGIFRSFSARKSWLWLARNTVTSRGPEAADLLAVAVNITSAVTEFTVAQSFRLLLVPCSAQTTWAATMGHGQPQFAFSLISTKH
jgi:hypothetical protein